MDIHGYWKETYKANYQLSSSWIFELSMWHMNFYQMKTDLWYNDTFKLFSYRLIISDNEIQILFKLPVYHLK